jgi:TonB family protein
VERAQLHLAQHAPVADSRGTGRIEKSKQREIEISIDPPRFGASLPKEIIRAVIRDHLAQVRYCYERALVSSPGLFGKIATEFVIDSEGSVIRAAVTQSTMKDAGVEQCVLAKIQTWRFPRPNGGGVVVVKYPFVFKTSG